MRETHGVSHAPCCCRHTKFNAHFIAARPATSFPCMAVLAVAAAHGDGARWLAATYMAAKAFAAWQLLAAAAVTRCEARVRYVYTRRDISI